MGSNSSKPATITTEYRKDTIIKTVLKTDEFRLAFQMKALKEESRSLQNMWKDFITGGRNTFYYNTATKHNQQIKIIRMNDGSLELSVVTNVDLKEEDLESFTKMFDTISKNIEAYDKSEATGLLGINNGSSTNLLIVE
jgi:hypothetical protein